MEFVSGFERIGENFDETREVHDKMRSHTRPSRADAWQAAAAWVVREGGIVEGIDYDASDFDGGAKATDALATDTLILRIPENVWITAKVARTSPVGCAANIAIESAGEKLTGTPADLVLAFFLAADFSRSDNPFHSPYYDTLPVGDDAPSLMLPRCWSDAEIDACLRGSPLASEAKRTRAAVAADYATVTALAQEAAPLPDGWPLFESFDWAVAIVSSRAFQLSTSTGEIDALVPVMDMLNHARPRQTRYDVVQVEGMASAALEVRTLRAAAGGAAVHITYGAKGSAQLLGMYGFAMVLNFEPDGSSNDVRELPLPIAAGSAQPAYLVHVPSSHAPLRIGPKSYAYGALNKAVDAFRAAAFAEWAAAASPGASKLEGVALEVRALRKLLEGIDEELSRYGKDEESASVALTSPPEAPEAVRNAAGYRVHVWTRRVAAAAAVVLNEIMTLAWYRLIVSLILDVLSPSSGNVADGPTSDARRASAQRLKAEVEAERAQAVVQAAAPSQGPMSTEGQVAALRRHASRGHAASVAMVYLQIRFPALLKDAPGSQKMKKTTPDGAEGGSRKKMKG